MELQTPTGARLTYDILDIFPFTSESKRMGIVVRDTHTGEVLFLQKGADVVMARIVQRNDWLEEETGNMAREGLRTLVVARKRLTPQQYAAFKTAHHAASIRLDGRGEAMISVVAEHLEHDLELLGLTGVEDKLQDEVKGTLELLRNGGIKIWMLTGDKIETARCIAISTKLVARNQYIHEVAKCELSDPYVLFRRLCFEFVVKTSDQVRDELEFLQSKLDCCLVIDGESLQVRLSLDMYLCCAYPIHSALFEPVQERVHRDHNEVIGCCCLSMLSHPESRCRKTNPTSHQETGLLYWRRWQ